MAGTVNVEAAELCHCPNHDGTYIVKIETTADDAPDFSERIRASLPPAHGKD